MGMRLFLIYVLAELAVVVALASTIGFGWTVLLLVATFALGLALAGSQLKAQVRRLRSGLGAPQSAVSDGMLVALGTVLTVVPGLLTSLLGLLLLAPPTRVLARPAVAALAARTLGRMPLLVATGMPRRTAHGDFVDGEYVDGEVVDVTDYQQPRLPRPPVD